MTDRHPFSGVTMLPLGRPAMRSGVRTAWHDRFVSWPPRIGELLPRPEDAYGVHEKLAGYSLNLQHADGGHKAVLFEAVLDITAVDVDYLVASLIAGIADTPVRAVRENAPHGYLCEVPDQSSRPPSAV